MNNLTFYEYRDKLGGWVTVPGQLDIWIWLPAWPSIFPPDLEMIDALTAAGWEDAGSGDGYEIAIYVLCGQLAEVRLIGAHQDHHIWTTKADWERVKRLPVILAFQMSAEHKRPAQQEIPAKQDTHNSMIYTDAPQSLPPPQFGEMALIASGERASVRWKRCSITKLDQSSQDLQRRLGAALTRLASAYNLERSAWLMQWEEIQHMAQQLAADYWHAYQDSQAERPQPLNVWEIREGKGAWAAMTMIQDGAHASLNNKGKWEQEHMVEQGKHQGLMLPRYIHSHTSGETEYWMQHPEEAQAPVDPDLVSQEVLRQQAKLSDLEADLITLAPVYLLAKGEEEVAISPEQLLRDLDIQPKQKDGYSAGYRPEELQRVIDAFERLAWLQLKTRQRIQKRRGVKPHLITAESPYLIITERIWQEPLLDDAKTKKLLGWKYQIVWLKKFTGDTEAGKQLGVLLKKSLSYRQDQRWEKRLARYLTIHLCVAAHKGQASINCIIRHVLEQCGLTPSERDRARPAEYAQQFEKAMDHLKRDGIIGDWMPKINRQTDLPARAWLDLWLDSSFRVTQAQTALEAGYQKMIDAAQKRATALPKPPQSKKQDKR